MTTFLRVCVLLLSFSLLSVQLPFVQTAQADSLLESLLPKQKSKSLALHGNIESKVYHKADCKHYNCKNCTEVFATEKEAQAAGYTPCSLCGSGKSSSSKKSGLHGNPTSKILHGPSCKYYSSPASSEVFPSVEKATKLGYRLCTICNGK